MSWTSATSLALETTTRAADRPVLVGSHVYDPSVMLPIWDNVDGDASTAHGYFKTVKGEVIDEFDVVKKQ